MPVHTQLRNLEGEPIELRWGAWHTTVLDEAMRRENPDEEVDFFPSSYTFTQNHTFTDPDDGEVLVIVPGMKYVCWR